MGSIRVGGHTVRTSSESRVVFPRDGITKGDILRYYAEIAPAMIPHLRNRRLTMQRFPEGIDAPAVFQKNIPAFFPSWIGRVTVPKEGGTVTHIVCNSSGVLIYLANQNCLTPHVGLARIDSIEYPDQMIFDLDPPGDDFEVVRSVAWSMKELLDEIRLAAYLKTTGSRGLHLAVPLDRRWDFDRVRAFARCVAQEIVRRRPKDVTLELLKRKRRGRLFLDTNRNGTAQTAVPAYAVRARDGAPVAMPITWKELEDTTVNARTFNIRNASGRADPWRGMAAKARSLAVAEKRLSALLPK